MYTEPPKDLFLHRPIANSHTVWRDIAGDRGDDLLKGHYAKSSDP